MNKNEKLNKEKAQEKEQEKKLHGEIEIEDKDAEAKEAEEKAEKKEKEEENETEKLKKEVEEWKNKYLYQAAEFDNYRKRTLKEKAELIKTAAERTISDILPVLDDMERAMQNIEKSDDAKALKDGVELVFDKLMKTLEKQGLKKIETKDKDFDTDFHEAIAMIPATDDKQKGKVIDCVQNGYTLNDKVIRHAKVAVGK